MVIDLDLCIGCNACISACNVENNVLVVGKDQVARGREMLWLRVDRYYTGEPENPRAISSRCRACIARRRRVKWAARFTPRRTRRRASTRWSITAASARAPAQATARTRCAASIGTTIVISRRSRTKRAQNPDVTVRARGVMEKCTYCTQRIEAPMCRPTRKTAPCARRSDHRLPAGMPDKGDRFGDLKDEKRGRQAAQQPAPLRPSRGTRHASTHDLSRALE